MRVVVLIKANPESEAGVLPSEQLITEMQKYNEDLVKAGVMLAGEGLHPSSKAARVSCESGKITVTDGPFTEAKELIAGFWIWQVKSMEEATEWAKRMPNPDNQDGSVEIRPIFDIEEFGDAVTEQQLAKDAELRAQL